MQQPLAFNRSAKISRQVLGDEPGEALIIDDCLLDPHQLRSIAERARYGTYGPHYPGLRSPVPPAAAAALLEPLDQIMREALCLCRSPQWREGFISIVTAPPASLAPIQRIPHFDGTSGKWLALLLYLDLAPSGGTAFYRHRSTGFERITENRLDEYDKALHTDIAKAGMPEPDYIRGNTAMFEQTAVIEQIFNRAAIYHGNRLHCGNFPADFLPDTSPVTGRLTLNIFLG